jgi:L-amino acid N-acyltransferase
MAGVVPGPLSGPFGHRRRGGGRVVGWAALSAWKSRCAYAPSVEVSVDVRHDLHRRGLGRALMLDLIERAQAAGHHTISGACTEQAASLALQESLGFERVACFREVRYKFGRWLDVAYMKLLLGQQIDKNEAVT